MAKIKRSIGKIDRFYDDYHKINNYKNPRSAYEGKNVNGYKGKIFNDSPKSVPTLKNDGMSK